MSRPTLAFERTGRGDPLLLLHGIGTTHDDFASLTPRLRRDFDVLSVDLPGHGASPPLAGKPTIAALADALEADLDAHGIRRAHVLGNSLGGRLALELGRRQRALSIVAIAPSGLALPPERLVQGSLMATARVQLRLLRPLIGPLAASRVGRTALLAGLRARPWRASEAEALALRDGFAGATGFWSMLWWSVLRDVPTGLDEITCPVVLAQGNLDAISFGQTMRYLPLIDRARFRTLLGAGHAPQSDVPGAIVALVHEAAAGARVGSPAPPLFQVA
ncbi:MAG: alpha/beta hydrolase [Myxococcales bacterium]|nr:MAG: alpha/beta hydrolase [Myxococcales bacterium]